MCNRNDGSFQSRKHSTGGPNRCQWGQYRRDSDGNPASVQQARVGVAVAPGGWAYDNAIYEVTAYPSRQRHGMSQTKRVNACQVQHPPGHLYFDLALDPTTPRQRIDLNINQKSNDPSLEDTLRALKRLCD